MEKQIRGHIFRCPICGQRFKHRAQHAGKIIRCRLCHERTGSAVECRWRLQRNEKHEVERSPQVSCRQAVIFPDYGNLPRPAVLLLEHRDEVFARLATDLAEAGVTVVRAATAWSALRACSRRRFDLVIANADPPVYGGWQLAEDLPKRRPTACLWLYECHKTAIDVSRAKACGVAELIAYSGDLLSLSELLLDCLAGKPPSPTKTRCAPWRHRNLAAAA